MKKFIGFMGFACLLACNNADTTSENKMESGSTMTDTSTTGQMDYAYTIEHPDNWVPGDKNNTKIVLESLKGYETNNIDQAIAGFADTVEVYLDDFQGKISKDSLKSIFVQGRGALQDMRVKMDDWESVKSKDGQTEFVSLWYRQYWTDKNGKQDSIYVMDDLKMKNGKIILLDEKTRRLSAANK